MNTTVINIRTDLGLKVLPRKWLKNWDLASSSLVNAYLKQAGKNQTVHFRRGRAERYLIKHERSGRRPQGRRHHTFNNSTEALEYLDKIIGKRRNGVEIEYSVKFIKQLKKAPKNIRISVRERLGMFVSDQFGPLLNNHALKGKGLD